MRKLISTVLFVSLAVWSLPAAAQSIDEALKLFNNRDYDEAAVALYDVLANDANPDHRDQAQIYLAETLARMKLFFPALYYYQDVFSQGRTNRYYLNAIEGLLAIQEELHDPVLVPVVIDANYDPEGFGQLDAGKIAQINYMIGEFSFRRGKNEDAKLFLEYVPPESPLHPRARYLLGILAVKKKAPDEAISHFKAILDLIDANTSNPEMRELRDLALLGLARVSYGLEHFEEATKYFQEVPRFSNEWFDAMYENAWAYYRMKNYGRALGELQSITAPFFEKRHIPEAFVIQGTTYFVNCQWDRVRRSVARFKKIYEPMEAALKAYLEKDRELVDYYRDTVAGGAGRFSVELAREVRRSKRFKDYYFMLQHLSWEREQLDTVGVWKGSSLYSVAKQVMDEQQKELEKVVGNYAKRRLSFLSSQLTHFDNQINILDFEVTDAERQWLEQGKEILKGRRARLPRPDIPTDQWQHWSFETEYWRDEVGYFQHSLRSECF